VAVAKQNGEPAGNFSVTLLNDNRAVLRRGLRELHHPGSLPQGDHFHRR